MNFLTFINGVRTFVSKVDFVDFANGTFRSRIQSKVLTANQLLEAPNKTGTIALQEDTQPLSSLLTSVSDIPSGSLGLIEKTGASSSTATSISAAGRSILQGTASDGRSALGLGTLATQNSNTLTLTGPVDFGGFSHNNFYFANSAFSESEGGLGVFVDRLQAANQRFIVTATPALSTGSELSGMSSFFDQSYENGAGWTGPNLTAVLEIDWSSSATHQYTYSTGLLVFHFYDYLDGGFLTPLSINLQFFTGSNNSWNDAGTYTPLNAQNKPLTISLPTIINASKLRITFLTRPTAQTTIITKIEYFASRQNNNERPQYLLSSSSGFQVLDSPDVYFGKITGSSANTQISPGSITLNNSETIAAGDISGKVATTAFVTNAVRPAVEATRPTAQTITVGGTTTLICNSVQLDTNSAYNSTTGVFTVPAGQGGIYGFTVYAGFTVAGNSVQINPARNGVIINSARGQEFTFATDIHSGVTNSGRVRLVAGDTLRFDISYASISGTATTTSTTNFPSISFSRLYA